MANIKIADLQSVEFEFADLSDLELEQVVGGGLGKKLRQLGRSIDRAVRRNVPGGWLGVVKGVLAVATGGATTASELV